jgi:hypothetical protein
MDTFDFPYHTYSTDYPVNGTSIQLGGNYVFTAPPAGPDLRVLKLHFPGMFYYPVTPLMGKYLNSDNFTTTASGTPSSLPSLSPVTLLKIYDYPVYQTSAGVTINTKNVLLPTAGKVWKVDAEWRVVSLKSTDDVQLKVGVRALDNGYNSLSTALAAAVDITKTGNVHVTAWFSDVADSSDPDRIIADWPGTATYLRFFTQSTGTITSPQTVLEFRNMTVTDDTTAAANGVDLSTNPQYNLAVLEKFYQDHKLYKTFQYQHPIYGLMSVKFNSPLKIPEGTKGGIGWVPDIAVELIEVLV